MPFHRHQRFAHPGSESAPNFTERVQDIFSLCRHRLLLIQHVAGVAVLCAQAQYILASDTCDGAFQDSGTRSSLADLLSYFRSHPRVFRLSHQSQRLLDLLVSNQTEEWRLLKLHSQALAQRVVEYRIARLIVEIGEDESVLVG